MTAEASPDEGTGRRGVRKRTIGIGVVIALTAAVGAALIGGKIIADVADVPPPAPAKQAAAAQQPAVPRVDLRRAPIGEAQISIGYPRTWKRLRSTDPGVPLIVADGSEASLLVRVAPVGLTVTPETLSVARNLTDSLVQADGRVDLLEEPGEVVLAGLPGYRYRYRFRTSDGKPGIHVHYFLFKRGQLISLVFQVLPASRLDALSGLIDQMALSFRSV